MVREWDHNSCPIMSGQILGWSDIMSAQAFEIIMHSVLWNIHMYFRPDVDVT